MSDLHQPIDESEDSAATVAGRSAAAARSTWTSVVVLFASHHGAMEADADHPYGHQRFENAASLVVGALLLAVGAGMAWSAIGKLENPHAAALAVAAVALVAKEILFRYMLKIATRVKLSMLVANAWDAPGVHDVRTRKMGDMIVVDATIPVEAGHDIAVAARRNVMARHRVLSLMTHVDPWHRPDLDHASARAPAERSGAAP